MPRDRDIDAFAQALRSVGEPIFGQDATRISMARLLAHLFEVTERFGMETRTELILLQRTMVVVEGVGAQPQPGDEHVGDGAAGGHRLHRAPTSARAAALRDLAATVRVLSRFGPRLPQMAEARADPRQRPAAAAASAGATPAGSTALGGALRRRGAGGARGDALSRLPASEAQRAQAAISETGYPRRRAGSKA